MSSTLPTLTAYETLREFVAFRTLCQGRSQALVARDLGYSPSQWSRKCAQGIKDSARMTVDDLERFIATNDDIAPIFYLLEKYCTDQKRLEQLRSEIERIAGLA